VIKLAADGLAGLETEVQPAEPGGALALRSALVSPLVANGRTIGALATYATTAGAYSDDHRRLLERVSRQVASVIANVIVFEQTQEASLTDALTGLANRRALGLQLQRDLARAEREHAPVSLLLLDVDDLKALNDACGHHVGDRALRRAGGILSSMQRRYDFCARYGGDEFVVVLWDCTAAQAEARRVALQQALSATTLRLDDTRATGLSASAGVATYPDDGATAEALLAIADQRMYADKTAHRKRASARTDHPPGAPWAFAV
jgi:diguanylate cyclase (GGDEF)-like protein